MVNVHTQVTVPCIFTVVVPWFCSCLKSSCQNCLHFWELQCLSRYLYTRSSTFLEMKTMSFHRMGGKREKERVFKLLICHTFVFQGSAVAHPMLLTHVASVVVKFSTRFFRQEISQFILRGLFSICQICVCALLRTLSAFNKVCTCDFCWVSVYLLLQATLIRQKV